MDVMLERCDWSNILGLDDAEHYKQDSAWFQVYYTVTAKRFDKWTDELLYWITLSIYNSACFDLRDKLLPKHLNCIMT